MGFPECKLVPFGSTFTGLGFKNCDLDIFVNLGKDFSIDETMMDKEVELRSLTKRVSSILRLEDRFRRTTPILFCRVPIVRVVDRVTGARCDLNLISRMGIGNSVWLRSCAESDRRVRSLILLVKFFCARQGLTGHGRGDHLNGYTVVLMAIFFLQTRQLLHPLALQQRVEGDQLLIIGWNFAFCSDRGKLPSLPQVHSSLMELLVDFFRFYSGFSFSTEAVCPLEGDILLRYSLEHGAFLPSSIRSSKTFRDQTVKIKWDTPLVVQDPFELNRNVAEKVSMLRLNRLVNLFSNAGDLLYKITEEQGVEEGSRVCVWMLFEPRLPSYCGVKESLQQNKKCSPTPAVQNDAGEFPDEGGRESEVEELVECDSTQTERGSDCAYDVSPIFEHGPVVLPAMQLLKSRIHEYA